MNENFKVEDTIIETPMFIGSCMIPDKICDDLISYFDKNERVATPGLSINLKYGDEINNNKKESLDLRITPDDYHFPIWDYRQYLQNALEKYTKQYDEVNHLSVFRVGENYNIQKYPIGGGFKTWHFERSCPKDISRHLVFMTYLNDVDDGGTEFKYQKFTCPARKGLTLIWPTDWTFTHRGQVSHTKEKYIITGWYNAEMNNE